MTLGIRSFSFAEQLILYQRIVLISLGIHFGWGDEMEVAEYHGLDYLPHACELIVFKSTLVYWGEEKDSALRSLGVTRNAGHTDV